MLNTESILLSGDNTDIKKFKIIKVLGNSFKRYAKLGEIIKATVHKRTYNKNIIKKKIYYCLITSLRKNTRRKNGHFIKMNKNKALTLDLDFKFLGTRVYGPVCKEIKKKQFKRIISYAKANI